MTKPTFETFADRTLDRVRATYASRGTEYGDTWAHAQWLAMKATRNKLGLNIPDSALRALAAAALFDVKYQRLEGGYKDDSVIDGIAYGGLWAEEMAQHAQQPEFDLFMTGPVRGINGAVEATPRNGNHTNGVPA